VPNAEVSIFFYLIYLTFEKTMHTVFAPHFLRVTQTQIKEIKAATNLVDDVILIIVNMLQGDVHVDFLGTRAHIQYIEEKKTINRSGLTSIVRAPAAQWKNLLTPGCQEWFNSDGYRRYELSSSYTLSLDELCLVTIISTVRSQAERLLPSWFHTYRKFLRHNFRWERLPHVPKYRARSVGFGFRGLGLLSI
jgi:hypothetical protein